MIDNFVFIKFLGMSITHHMYNKMSVLMSWAVLKVWRSPQLIDNFVFMQYEAMGDCQTIFITV